MSQTAVLGAIPNQPGAQFRADVNSSFQALATANSGSTAPTVTYAYMLWADTSTSPATIKMRNGANNAWITVGTADTANLGLVTAASPTFTGTVTLPAVTVTGDMTFSGTGFLDLPIGTTAQRPGSPNAGMLRYNSTTTQFEGYTTAWVGIAPLVAPTFTGTVTASNNAVAAIATLTDGATITPDFSAACNFTVTLGGNRTIANPTNVTAGQSGSIFILQDATGSRTASWGANWKWAGGTAPVLSTAANAVDRIDYVVRTTSAIQAVITKAYA